MLNPSPFDNIQAAPYSGVRGSLCDGDLLLFEGTDLLDNIIQQGTGSLYSHCAMLYWWNGRLLVMESIINYGVRALPFSDYVKSYTGKIRVGRHKQMDPAKALLVLSAGTNYLGHPYGTDEILDILGHITLGIHGYKGTGALICSEYVALCYAAGGLAIPPDTGGYWFPRTLAECPDFTPLFEVINA